MNKPRLIDANALMDYTQNQKSRTIDCNDIARFPTAYNVDAVVQQLEECSVNYCKEYGYAEDENVLYLPDAIEIVRKGGAVDDETMA